MLVERKQRLRLLVVVIVKMREGRDAVVMISMGGKGCWMKGGNVPFFVCERVVEVEVGCDDDFFNVPPLPFFQCIPWLKGP